MVSKTNIEMAREAGIRDCTCDGTRGCRERVAELVRAGEREACAKVVLQREQEAHGSDFPDAYDFAKAIRARGNT